MLEDACVGNRMPSHRLRQTRKKNYPVVDQGETGRHAIFANPNHNSNPFL